MRFTLISVLLTGAACGAEQVASSPLFGATPVDSAGVGTVAEAVRAGSYTYVRLADSEQTWFVVMGHAPRVGAEVAWRGYAEIDGFASKRLDRTFDHLVFASIDATKEDRCTGMR